MYIDTGIHDYKQRADQYMARPGRREGAAAAEAAEQGGGRGVGLAGVPCHGGSRMTTTSGKF